MKVKCVTSLLGAFLACFPAHVLAQGEHGGFFLGTFVAVGADAYAGDATPLSVLPLFGFRGETFEIATNGASGRVLLGDGAEPDAFLRPRFFALTHTDTPELAGIDRDVTVDAGLSYTQDLLDLMRLDVSIAQEITGEHDGQEANLRLTQRFVVGALPLGVYAGATWRSEELSSYLYGVTPAEAQAGRPAFKLGATTSPYIGINTSLPLSQRVRLFGVVQADFLDADIANSSIVAEDRTLSLGVGIQFSF